MPVQTTAPPPASAGEQPPSSARRSTPTGKRSSSRRTPRWPRAWRRKPLASRNRTRTLSSHAFLPGLTHSRTRTHARAPPPRPSPPAPRPVRRPHRRLISAGALARRRRPRSLARRLGPPSPALASAPRSHPCTASTSMTPCCRPCASTSTTSACSRDSARPPMQRCASRGDRSSLAQSALPHLLLHAALPPGCFSAVCLPPHPRQVPVSALPYDPDASMEPISRDLRAAEDLSAWLSSYDDERDLFLSASVCAHRVSVPGSWRCTRACYMASAMRTTASS